MCVCVCVCAVLARGRRLPLLARENIKYFASAVTATSLVISRDVLAGYFASYYSETDPENRKTVYLSRRRKGRVAASRDIGRPPERDWCLSLIFILLLTANWTTYYEVSCYLLQKDFCYLLSARLLVTESLVLLSTRLTTYYRKPLDTYYKLYTYYIRTEECLLRQI